MLRFQVFVTDRAGSSTGAHAVPASAPRPSPDAARQSAVSPDDETAEASVGQPITAPGAASAFALRHAHLLGPESNPVAGTITLQGDFIECVKPHAEAAGLALQVALDASTLEQCFNASDHPAGAGQAVHPGVITLRTCLLPERDRPYLLSLELARHAIMLFFNKLEDWQLVELPSDHEIMQRFETARVAFTAALALQTQQDADGRALPRAETADDGTEPARKHFTARADRLARRALAIAIDAGERLALEAASRSMPARLNGETYANAVASARSAGRAPSRPNAPVHLDDQPGVALATRPLIGCAISPGSFSESAQAVARSFDFVSMPMRWLEMEPIEGRYAFKGTDQWIEWAVRKARMNVVAGPLIDFRPSCVPDWLYIWENDFDTLRGYVLEHVKNLVTRYRKTIGRWTVVTGIHVNDNFRFSFEQMRGLTGDAVRLVRKLHPIAKINIEIDQPWGEYHTENRRSMPPLFFAETIAGHAGVSVDGLGLRVQIGQPLPGQSARDLASFSAMLDRYAAATEKPITINAIGAPSDETPATAEPAMASRHPGAWRTRWSEQNQADWAASVIAIAASKPFVQSICWQDLYDTPQQAEMPRGGLIATSGASKPIASRLAAMTTSLRENTPPNGVSPADLLK